MGKIKLRKVLAKVNLQFKKLESLHCALDMVNIDRLFIPDFWSPEIT